MHDLSRLAELLRTGRLILFIGADLSELLTGLPSRADLARGLAHRYTLAESSSLADVAQRVARGSRAAFTDYLNEQIKVQHHQPRRFYQLLTRLPAPVMITVAYDGLLQTAFEQAGIPINRVIRDVDLPFVQPGRPMLIKLYGDIQQPDTLVVTEDDHYRLWHDPSRAAVLNRVRDVLNSAAMLLIGYDLSDPDFKQLWTKIREEMGRFVVGAYAIWQHMPNDEREVWEGRHIKIIDAEPLAFLERLVTTL
jgi:hypothetical protein